MNTWRNDRELWDDADLNWYDYGFRNYDAQIGRFTQLDPLTWHYSDLTNYQYASNDPINNIDIDGSEGGLSTLANPIVLKEVVVNLPKTAAKAAAATTSALNITSVSLAALRSGLIIQDNLRSAPVQHLSNATKTQLYESSLLWSMLSKFSSWLSHVSRGSGSYQDYGIIFTGNNNGIMEFLDYARKETLVAIDMGALFGSMKAANLHPKVFRDLLSSPRGLKY